MKVIAISGWKRSGKDTAAERLVEQHNFLRVSFADPLKDMVSSEFHIPREHCDDPEFKEAPILHLPVSPKDGFTLNLSKMLCKEFRSADGHVPMEPYVDPSGTFLGVMGRTVAQLYWTPRALCILKGSTNRTVTSDYWVQKAITEIKCKSQSSNDYHGVVISDLRYKSEVAQLRSAFGKDLITVRVNRFDDCNSQDPSERDLDNGVFDVVVDNKGELEEFLAKVDSLVTTN